MSREILEYTDGITWDPPQKPLLKSGQSVWWLEKSHNGDGIYRVAAGDVYSRMYSSDPQNHCISRMGRYFFL